MTDEEGWKSVVDEVLDKHKKLDILVNNAGIGTHGNVEIQVTKIGRRLLM